MDKLDVICIGAVNYDYMFHCDEEDLILKDKDAGNEDLSNPVSDVEDDILELVMKNKEYTTQIGGSAFITLKVIKHILPMLNVAYVGVCGTPNQFDLRYGKSNNIEEELAHLDDRTWLFRTTDRYDDPYSRAIAKSIVRLHNHTRNCIKIAPCANNTLLDRIHKQEELTGQSFAEYLSQARWIHLSSLSDFDQFEAIMQYVIQARGINPKIKVSMDPGYEYTSLWRSRLQPLINYADYVFLNKSEKGNVGLNAPVQKDLYSNMADYFSAYNPDPDRTLIIKYDDRHELLRFEEGKSRIRTVYHEKLHHYQLNNDTGAGDSFAGGVIAGMLFSRINYDLAEAIKLGVVAAKGRMTSFDYENPYKNIQKAAHRYLDTVPFRFVNLGKVNK